MTPAMANTNREQRPVSEGQTDFETYARSAGDNNKQEVDD